ncbi:hypothetical protein RF11_10253 [Thelohanellus kitauei]|uniref:Uncharacterized protein n=1 Tax=Thelohanellus kitauei TaxID=669202 RepID=A0A0C2N779_THEKT|nr:hypothetical protein RF11_10253 [Thelohanellus kitauei]
MMASNAPLQFEKVDAALHRRSVFLNFPTSFVTRPRRIGEKQIDSKLGDMIEKGTVLHRQFMWMLVLNLKCLYRSSSPLLPSLYHPKKYRITLEELMVTNIGTDLQEYIDKNLQYHHRPFLTFGDILSSFRPNVPNTIVCIILCELTYELTLKNSHKQHITITTLVTNDIKSMSTDVKARSIRRPPPPSSNSYDDDHESLSPPVIRFDQPEIKLTQRILFQSVLSSDNKKNIQESQTLGDDQ